MSRGEKWAANLWIWNRAFLKSTVDGSRPDAGIEDVDGVPPASTIAAVVGESAHWSARTDPATEGDEGGPRSFRYCEATGEAVAVAASAGDAEAATASAFSAATGVSAVWGWLGDALGGEGGKEPAATDRPDRGGWELLGEACTTKAAHPHYFRTEIHGETVDQVSNASCFWRCHVLVKTIVCQDSLRSNTKEVDKKLAFSLTEHSRGSAAEEEREEAKWVANTKRRAVMIVLVLQNHAPAPPQAKQSDHQRGARAAMQAKGRRSSRESDSKAVPWIAVILLHVGLL